MGGRDARSTPAARNPAGVTGVDVVAPAPIAKGSDVAPAEPPPPNGDLDPGAALRPPPRVSSALNAPALVNFSVVSTLASSSDVACVRIARRGFRLEGRARVTATGAVLVATMVIIISSHSRALL